MSLRVVPLGAGQDVGKSCVLVTMGGKTIMFDCGIHMGYSDERRYPDFKYISRSGNFTEAISCIIITHFHLDHCGALPYFTEVCGYRGPIYMTYATRAIVPLMLEDFRRVLVDRKGGAEGEHFSSDQIRACMQRVTAVDLLQTIHVDDQLELRAYYAGHVLGAAMFLARVRQHSVLYTGDYNMTPDRHLGAASVDRLCPDLLITESTYATTLRSSKQAREHEFLSHVHACVARGGKVLIPVFALGRVQELCILLEDFWERNNLQAPIYFSSALTAKANTYYRMLIKWTSSTLRAAALHANPFDFKHVRMFDRSMIDQEGPCVLFATPGMLHGGLSLEVFKRWGCSARNTVILPGYCVEGTVGHKLMSGHRAGVVVDHKTTMDVACEVCTMSFSAHADANGILEMVRQCHPGAVMLVHGERHKMQLLKAKIIKDFQVRCFDPPNGVAVTITTRALVPLQLSVRVIKDAWARADDADARTHEYDERGGDASPTRQDVEAAIARVKPRTELVLDGILLLDGAQGAAGARLIHAQEVADELGMTSQEVTLSCVLRVRQEFHAFLGVYPSGNLGMGISTAGVAACGEAAAQGGQLPASEDAHRQHVAQAAVTVEQGLSDKHVVAVISPHAMMVLIRSFLVGLPPSRPIVMEQGGMMLQIGTVCLSPSAAARNGVMGHVVCKWQHVDDILAIQILDQLVGTCLEVVNVSE